LDERQQRPAAILDALDDVLIRGLSIDEIYSVAHAREKRIEKGNLHRVLERLEGLQVDDEGRGLVLAYNEADREIFGGRPAAAALSQVLDGQVAVGGLDRGGQQGRAVRG
jgi:hypothetical protein